MFNIGLPELIVIFIVVLLLFGAKALPEIARSLAQSVGIFKREVSKLTEEPDEKTVTPKESNPTTKIVDDSIIGTSNDYDENTEKRDWRPKA